MHYVSLDQFLTDGKPALAKGPVAIVFAEDPVEVDTTLRHHLAAGFVQVLFLAPEGIDVPASLEPKIHWISHDLHAEDAVPKAVTRLIEAAPGTWLYYCYNAEYLFFPFSSSRSVAKLLAFHTEKRRGYMLTYIVD